MGSVVTVTGQYIPLYRRIGELDPAERETAEPARRARGGAPATSPGPSWPATPATSLDPVHALAHMR